MSEASRNSCCRVRTFCCGCTLKTGCLFIGSLQLIGGLLLVLELSLAYFKMAGESSGTELDVLNKWFGVALASRVAQVVCAAILIHGARKGRAGFLLCWIIIYIIGLVLTVVGLLLKAVIVGIVEISIGLILGIYFCIVVNSHRLNLLDVRGNVDIEVNAPSTMEMKEYINMDQQNIH